MTTRSPKSAIGYQLPDPPQREPDEMTAFNHLATTGNAHHLTQHFGKPETTLVAGEHFISLVPTGDITGLHFPDLMVAFNVNPAAYYRSNAYFISEQGKPPDFVLEIASRSTGRTDVVEKRKHYAALGIPEYWRFDETGQHHGTKLAGDQIVQDRYEPFAIKELTDGNLQGYSQVLNLNLRWENGQLVWYDPATGRPILTYEDQRDRAVTERERADAERQTRLQEREQTDARIRELEDENRRLRNQ